MSCSAARKWFWAYLDGSAPARARQHLEAHLSGCPACTKELAELRALEQAATEAVLDSPAADLTGSLMAAVSAEPVWWSPTVPSTTPPWFLAVLATGGVMALVGAAAMLFILARLFVWNLAVTGLINPLPALAAGLTARVPGWWLTLWSAVEPVLRGLYMVVLRVPAPVLLFAGLVLLVLEAWVASWVLDHRNEVFDR
ncbi:MAG: zf-HC2 domain-containing protein [Bacillota bacterium]